MHNVNGKPYRALFPSPLINQQREAKGRQEGKEGGVVFGPAATANGDSKSLRFVSFASAVISALLVRGSTPRISGANPVNGCCNFFFCIHLFSGARPCVGANPI